MSSTGSMVISWRSALQDGAGNGVFARRFSSTGAALASEFQVHTYTLGDQSNPMIGSDGARRFVVAWNSNGQDGSGNGAFAQRFNVPIALDVDVPLDPAHGGLEPFVTFDEDLNAAGDRLLQRITNAVLILSGLRGEVEREGRDRRHKHDGHQGDRQSGGGYGRGATQPAAAADESGHANLQQLGHGGDGQVKLPRIVARAIHQRHAAVNEIASPKRRFDFGLRAALGAATTVFLGGLMALLTIVSKGAILGTAVLGLGCLAFFEFRRRREVMRSWTGA